MSTDIDKLRQVAERHSLTHAGMAEVLGWSKSAVGMWLRGQRIPSRAAIRLCDVILAEPAGMMAGIVEQAAAAHPDNRGRKPKVADEMDRQIAERRAAGESWRSLARSLSISRTRAKGAVARVAREGQA